jgi:hypothetical protein
MNDEEFTKSLNDAKEALNKIGSEELKPLPLQKEGARAFVQKKEVKMSEKTEKPVNKFKDFVNEFNQLKIDIFGSKNIPVSNYFKINDTLSFDENKIFGTLAATAALPAIDTALNEKYNGAVIIYQADTKYIVERVTSKPEELAVKAPFVIGTKEVNS